MYLKSGCGKPIPKRNYFSIFTHFGFSILEQNLSTTEKVSLIGQCKYLHPSAYKLGGIKVFRQPHISGLLKD